MQKIRSRRILYNVIAAIAVIVAIAAIVTPLYVSHWGVSVQK